jgi:hypothetical protein
LIVIRARQAAVAAGMVMVTGCGFGSPSTFTVSNASVDPTYTCPAGANNAKYDLRGTIDANNGTSNAVTIATIDATMTLATVKGPWLQKIGDKYDAANVTFTPSSVGAGAKATLVVTVPSACTGRSPNTPVAEGEYTVTFTVKTSAGTFKLDSKEKHRILTG